MEITDVYKMEALEEIAERMLKDTTLNLTVEKIAELTKLPVKIVKEIKEVLGFK